MQEENTHSHDFDAGDPTYTDLVRRQVSSFHPNFSAGQSHKNGELVLETIEVDSNGVFLTGRQAFVERLKRYDEPFPGLQLKDRIVLVDDNKAAVHYILQGEHRGPLGQLPASRHKIEAMSGEIFEFDQNGLATNLITVTKLDHVMAQVQGAQTVDRFENVTLLPTKTMSVEYVEAIRRSAGTFHKNFSAGEFGRNGCLVAQDIRVNSNGALFSGRDAFVERIQRYKTPFPDMVIIDEHIVVEGNRAAIGYVMTGTHLGDFSLPEGGELAATGRVVRVRGIEFMEFDENGFLAELITISNGLDFITQLTR